MKEILNKTDWLKRKEKGIGGSEISAIMGVNPYKTAIDVYLSKTERVKKSDNLPMRTGVVLEPLIAEVFSEETGAEIIPPPKKGMYEILSLDEKPYILGSPDRRYKDSGDICILECKSTGLNYTEVPPYWFLQLMWYLGIDGKERGAVAWLKDNREFQYTMYMFDKEQFDFMVDVADRFWNDNVLKGNPPEISEKNKNEITKLYKSHKEGKVIYADSGIKTKLITLARLKELQNCLKDKIDDIESSVKLEMKDSEAILDKDTELVTWRQSGDTKRFDLELFKQEQPELYKKYINLSPGSRRFLLKKNKILSEGIIFNEEKLLNEIIALPQAAESREGKE